jgi:endonuclease/exonuclease/phosphatase (EEP) superfamily protein YafD
MFVEFADHHYDNLKDFLQSTYPYTNSTTRSKKFVGSMVFSKYPLTNKAYDFPQGMRRYGYFSLPFADHEIYFYLVHTSSPDSYSHFLMRNEQLTTFVQDIKQHESDKKHNDIVAVGDFNITPWSSYYSILSDAFSGQLINVTKRLPFLFTWKFKTFPLFQAHIDHVWTSSSLIVKNLRSISMPGSDHKAFLFTLQL